MKSRIERLETKNLIGMKMHMSLAENRTNELWRAFMPRRREISERVSAYYYSLQSYGRDARSLFSPEESFTKWAAVEVSRASSPPEGMESYLLEGGLYAVFVHSGPASAFGSAMSCIFDEWFPGSGYGLDDREHFELLPSGYDPLEPNAKEEIWIPVRETPDPAAHSESL